MDPMKTAPQWGPFLSSYMGQTTPAMKGVVPSSRSSGLPGGDMAPPCPEGSFLGPDGRCQMTSATRGQNGIPPCPEGSFLASDGTCKMTQANRNTIVRSQPCPEGSYLAPDGTCQMTPGNRSTFESNVYWP